MSKKHTVLITGCSDGGLGSHLALQFQAAGWRVFATARNLAKLKEAKKSGLEILHLETLSDDSIRKCVAEVSELTGGSLDALVNNAGAGYSMPVMDIDIQKGRELFELNVWSIISVTRAFLPLLMQSTREGGALLINHGSLSGTIAATGPFAGVYNASKAAAASFTENLRLELQPWNIRVINLLTGAVRSNFHVNAPRPELPPDSLFNIAKDIVEQAMDNSDDSGDTDAAKWARQVVKELSKRSPAYWIWRGKFSTLVRLGNILPLGFFDRIMKKMVGLDIIEKRVQQRRSTS
ncbi:hypothetical protein ABZX51_002139 [Aspergillus tubingensis]|nr:hypothetical protein AtubIFM61612_005919 [Aspergillus tubingensis]